MDYGLESIVSIKVEKLGVDWSGDICLYSSYKVAEPHERKLALHGSDYNRDRTTTRFCLSSFLVCFNSGKRVGWRM